MGKHYLKVKKPQKKFRYIYAASTSDVEILKELATIL
jgi:hypothetical protein